MHSKPIKSHQLRLHRARFGRASSREPRTATTLFAVLLVAVAGIVVFGCPPPESGTTPKPGTVSHSLSGMITDNVTGKPIIGGVVEFAGMSATSDSGGAYNLDLGDTGVVMTGTLSIHADGYTGFTGPQEIDAGKDWSAGWRLDLKNGGSLSPHQLKGTVMEGQTNPGSLTEIPTGSSLIISVLNESGGKSLAMVSYDQAGGGFNIQPSTWGSDCVVSVFAKPPSSSPTLFEPFCVIMEHVDLSSSTYSGSLNVVEAQTGESVITITGDAQTNPGTLYLMAPSCPFYAADFTLDANKQATLRLWNPRGFQGFWDQMRYEAVGSDTKTIHSVSPVAPIQTSVALPTVPDKGPTGSPDFSSLSYNAGVLSIDPVAGASGLLYVLSDASGTEALVVSSNGSATLPGWLQTQLAGKTITINIYVFDFTTAIDLSIMGNMLGNAGIAPDTEMGFVDASGSKNLTF